VPTSNAHAAAQGGALAAHTTLVRGAGFAALVATVAAGLRPRDCKWMAHGCEVPPPQIDGNCSARGAGTAAATVAAAAIGASKVSVQAGIAHDGTIEWRD
jgi:hypothetical protein